MTLVSEDEVGAGTRVLELLQVTDLEALRERSKMLSVEESADLLIPVVAELAAEDGGAAAQRALQPALGVALYQSLIGEPLSGASVDVVVAQVVAGEFKKPREVDARIPRALEAIILRATRKRPDERFADLRELGTALLPFGSKHVRQSYSADFPKAGPNVGAILERRLEKGEDLKLLVAALAIALPFVIASRQSDEAPAPTPTVEQHAASPSPVTAASTAREAAPEPPSAPASARDQPSARAEEVAQPAPSRARTDTASEQASGAASESQKYLAEVAVEPRTAWLMLDNKPAGRGRLRRELLRDGKTHALHVGAPGYQVQALHFTDAPPPTTVVLAKRPR